MNAQDLPDGVIVSQRPAELYLEAVVRELGFDAKVRVYDRRFNHGDPLGQRGYAAVKVYHIDRGNKHEFFFSGYIGDDFESEWQFWPQADYCPSGVKSLRSQEEAERFSKLIPALYDAYDMILKGQV